MCICLDYLLERKAVIASLPLHVGKKPTRNNVNDNFGKGFHVLKDHVLNRLMTLKTAPSPKSKCDTQTDKVTTVTLRMRAES